MRHRLGLSGLIFGLLALCLVALPSRTTSAREETGGVSIEVGKGTIDFRAGNKLVTRYHIDPSVAKPYFWPVNAPNGVTITRGWPMEKAEPGEITDHVHQKSVWFCHGDVIPEGLELKQKIKNVAGVDFWSEANGHGKIVCTEVGTPQKANTHASVTTKNEWQTADGVKIMDEVRTIHCHDLGSAYLIVLDIDLHASVCPITFGDTKEGSMGVRVRGQLTEKVGKGTLTNAEGAVGEKNLWGTQSVWCDYSGKVGDAEVGITLLDDPSNPHPACWHSRGYGLMAANPFGRAGHAKFPGVKNNNQLVKLARGEHLKLRYGILCHNGDAKEAKVAERFQQFVKLR